MVGIRPGKDGVVGEVVLRAVGEYCIIGNALEEWLGCIRKLVLGEWSQGT